MIFDREQREQHGETYRKSGGIALVRVLRFLLATMPQFWLIRLEWLHRSEDLDDDRLDLRERLS